MLQDGDDRTDPRCARCHQPCTAPMVYRDGFWFHAQCFHDGSRQLRHAMRLANALAKRVLPRLQAANLAQHSETNEAGHDQIDRDEVIEKARENQDEDPRDERQQG